MADADVVFAVYMLLCSLFVADLIVGMEELELHYRCRGRCNFRNIIIATISVRMASAPEPALKNERNTIEKSPNWHLRAHLTEDLGELCLASCNNTLLRSLVALKRCDL